MALERGDYIVAAELSGYIPNFRHISLGDYQIFTRQDLVLSPLLNEDEIRIILTWGLTPEDLEAHLTAPSETGCRYHCYYDEKDIPVANLNLDDRDGYGPETITTTEQTTDIYRYYVHNFSNLVGTTSDLAQSGATVTVYFRDQEPVVSWKSDKAHTLSQKHNSMSTV